MTEAPTFTTDEIQLLLAGLDAHDSTLTTPQRAEHALGMLEGMLGFGMSPESRDAQIAKGKAELTEKVKGDTLKREAVVLLKAKLLGLRDKSEVGDIDLSADSSTDAGKTEA